MLRKGEVLAFKTDTVWGFGVHPSDNDAIDKIYEIKKRDLKKPLILMSDDISYLKKYIKFIPNYANLMIEKYLPGGLTLIFEKSDFCSNKISSGLNTVGIRIPDSKDFLEIIKNVEGRVLATTSCNISNEAPVKNYKEAYEKFSNLATIIKPLDDKENKNLPSTVILCENENYKILRQGEIVL